MRELFSSTDFSINPDDISIMGGIEEGEEKTWVAVGSLGPEVLIWKLLRLETPALLLLLLLVK